MKARGSRAQWLRRGFQLGTLGFVVWSAFTIWWRNYKVAHNHPRLVGLFHGEGWAKAYAANEEVLSWWGEPYRASLDWLGMPWAANLGGVGVVDPIMAGAHVVETGHFSWSLFGAAAIPLLIALILGKVFCSHLCPMRLVFEIGQRIRGGLLYLDIPVASLRSPGRFGGWVLLGGLLATLTGSAAIWVLVLPYVGLGVGIFMLVTGAAATVVLVPALLLAFDVIVAPGQWCNAFCPTGWLLEQVGRFAPWRLRKQAEAPPCPTGCHSCIRACPYALSPKDMSHLPSCDACGLCVPACPDGKLFRGFGLLALLLMLPVLSVPTHAEAHHNKGLPHYGYFENYPQVPTEEYVVVDGDWEFGGTIFNFQGLDRRSADTPNDVKFYLYLYDLKGDAPYTGAVKIDVYRGSTKVTSFERSKPDEEAIYVSRETLPQGGYYELVATLPEGKAVRLGFDIELADEVNWVWLIALGAPIFLLFCVALLGRTKKGKRRLAKASVGALLLPGTAWGQAAADCADPQSIAAALVDAQGRNVMIMSGMPPLLFVLGMALLIGLSFLLLERLGAPRPSTWRFNLIKKRSVYELLRKRWFQAIPQLIAIVALVLLVYAGLFGSRVRNITPVAVWTIWWAGLIFAVALAGPLFCFACPWDGLSNLVTRMRAWARVEPLSLGFEVPRWMRNVYPAIFLFTLLSWAELGLGTTTDPRQTAWLGLSMAALAVTCALLFGTKAFCEHVCPVGRISGLYANFSPVEVRARNPKSCNTCETEDCLNGNELGYACPVGISLKTVADSSLCTMCTECVKSCRRYNVAFNLRAFGSQLHTIERPRMDLAWLALTLLALTLFHGLSMTTAWENPLPGRDSLLKWMGVTMGTSHVVNFTVGMLLASAVPILAYWLSCRGAAWLVRGTGVSTRRLFTEYAFALLPIALFYHLAHNAMHLFMEGGHILPLLSDPLGRGWDLFGTVGLKVGHLLSEPTLWAVQLVLILVGHLLGVVVAHRISRRLFSDPKAATRSLLPVTAAMVLISLAGLTLMVLDMNMRLGRA